MTEELPAKEADQFNRKWTGCLAGPQTVLDLHLVNETRHVWSATQALIGSPRVRLLSGRLLESAQRLEVAAVEAAEDVCLA